MNERQATYQKAAEISDRLLAEGYPLLGFEAFDMGGYAGFLFRKPDGGRWAFRVPRDNLELERVRAMLDAYL